MSKPSKEQIANGVAIAVTTAKRLERSKSSQSTGYSNDEFTYQHIYEQVLENMKNNH